MADGARRRRCCVDLFAKVKHEIFFTSPSLLQKLKSGHDLCCYASILHFSPSIKEYRERGEGRLTERERSFERGGGGGGF